MIVHQIVRIETPILDSLPTLVCENEDFYVVDKPHGMPVHPSGNFYHNSLLQILEREFG